MAWPTWVAARNGLSGLHARPAIEFLENRKPDGYIVSKDEWAAIERRVAMAHRLMPGNPLYQEALGWLHQLKLSLFADELTDLQVDTHAADAKVYFQEAIDSRPTWPYYWGNLALEHSRRGNYRSAEYSQALANASVLGPWENDTQRLVLDLGSETWEYLSTRAKRELILNTERGLQRQPHYAIRVVRDNGGWPRICDAIGKLNELDLPHLQTVCAEESLSK